MSRNLKQCAYCGGPASTMDHVPPKKLFTPPAPSNLVTVPACEGCNGGASDDDEIFRNDFSIMAGSFGESLKAAERIQPTLRSIRRNRLALERAVLSAVRVERYSTHGLYLGHGYAVPVDTEAHKRVLTRIVRGLYWNHFGGPPCGTIPVVLVFIDKAREGWQDLLSPLMNPPAMHVQIGDGSTFQYFYGVAADDPACSFWLMIFFRGAAERVILAHTGIS